MISGNQPDQAADSERQQIYDDDAGSRRSVEGIRGCDPPEKADHRYCGRGDDDAAEAAEYPHGRQRREYDQAGNEQRSHDAHAYHDGHRGKKRNQHIVDSGFRSSCPREIFIKSHRENSMIKENKQQEHDRG